MFVELSPVALWTASEHRWRHGLGARTRVPRSARPLKVSGLELLRDAATLPGPKGTKAVRVPAAGLCQPRFLH
jgi:hypothetical protein